MKAHNWTVEQATISLHRSCFRLVFKEELRITSSFSHPAASSDSDSCNECGLSLQKFIQAICNLYVNQFALSSERTSSQIRMILCLYDKSFPANFKIARLHLLFLFFPRGKRKAM